MLVQALVQKRCWINTTWINKWQHYGALWHAGHCPTPKMRCYLKCTVLSLHFDVVWTRALAWKSQQAPSHSPSKHKDGGFHFLKPSLSLTLASLIPTTTPTPTSTHTRSSETVRGRLKTRLREQQLGQLCLGFKLSIQWFIMKTLSKRLSQKCTIQMSLAFWLRLKAWKCTKYT